jgi:hypothetical protein
MVYELHETMVHLTAPDARFRIATGFRNEHRKGLLNGEKRCI